MKKIFLLLKFFLLCFVFMLLFIELTTASSFIRRRDRDHRDDTRHGKNWDKMDRELDDNIDGRHGETREEHRFQRPRPEQRQNQDQQNR